MQFPHDTNRRTLKNRRISTIRLQHLKYTQENCMRNCRTTEEPGRGAGFGRLVGPRRGTRGRRHNPAPNKIRMQFPHDTNRRTLKNRRISTIRLQHLKYTQGNCMRNWWESGPWGNKQHHADGLARSAAGQRPVSARSALGQRPLSARSAPGQRLASGPWGLKQRHAGGLARSAPAQHPLSGWRAARPCHGLGYSPGAPRRPNRTRRGWTRGPSTGRRAPWPRSCREP